MIRPELHKLRHHRTPWVILGLAALLVLAVPAYLALQPPERTDTYLSAVTAVFAVAGSLLAPVFGAWVVGHEYRQGTLRRVLAVDARRPHLLAVKGIVGAIALAVGLAAVAGLGVAASHGAATLNGDTLTLDGVVRELLAGGFLAMVTAAIAFGLSIILRSDAYAMIGAIALMVIFGPLLSMIPTIGNYTPSATAITISDWIANTGASSSGSVSVGVATVTLAATIAALFASATTLFTNRDV